MSGASLCRDTGRPLRTLVAAIVCAAGLGATAPAAQWVVDDDGPADFTSIQAAVNAVYVLSGDTILVKPGWYGGRLVLSSKDLVIRAEAGPFATVLDAGEGGSVVSLLNRTSATRLEGFTLTGGRDQTGGGVWIYGGAPVITRNLIAGNSAVGGYFGYGYGGGLEVYSSAAVITRNVIQGNTALDGGGGIDVYYSGTSTGTCCPVIAQNTILNNTVIAAWGVGGGILVSASEPWITSNIVTGNEAGSGGGLYVERQQGINDAPDVTQNLFFGDIPDAAASNGSFHLSASNLQEDPRLGPGPGVALWPCSNSPALDAAEAGVPAGADLSGEPGFVDSDFDGAPLGDLGALENRSEITGLTAAHDPDVPGAALLSWDGSVNASARFNIYAADGDPFRSDGGFCLASDLAQESFSDPSIIPPGQIRFYLLTGIDVVEGSRGFRSDGAPRPSTVTCGDP